MFRVIYLLPATGILPYTCCSTIETLVTVRFLLLPLFNLVV